MNSEWFICFTSTLSNLMSSLNPSPLYTRDVIVIFMLTWSAQSISFEYILSHWLTMSKLGAYKTSLFMKCICSTQFEKRTWKMSLFCIVPSSLTHLSKLEVYNSHVWHVDHQHDKWVCYITKAVRWYCHKIILFLVKALRQLNWSLDQR